MTWNTDISAAPKGQTIETTRTDKNGVKSKVSTFEPDLVILTTKCEKVIQSRWVPKHMVGKYPPREIPARWLGLAKDEKPVAWMPWPEPYKGE